MTGNTVLLGVMEGVVRAIQAHHRRSASASALFCVIVALGAIGLLWGGLLVWERWQNRARERARSARTLFDDLVLAHGLDADERRIMLRAAELGEIAEPAYVFVQPDSLDGVADEFDPARIASLRERLFQLPTPRGV